MELADAIITEEEYTMKRWSDKKDGVLYCIEGLEKEGINFPFQIYIPNDLSDTPDLIIERKKLFDSDWIMTIGEVCFILTLLAKISANYNALRSCILVLLCYDPTNFPKITNIIMNIKRYNKYYIFIIFFKDIYS